MKLSEAIDVLKDLKRLSTIPMTLREGIDTILLNEAIDTVVEALEKPLPCERCKKLEYMIENGLGWEDMENDISQMHEL